jgi:hypothetical protein
VINTVNDLDNVLYEISNESLRDSYDWQEHLVNFIKNREKGMPKQHPVGMSSFEGGVLGSMDALFASSADWITPQNDEGPYDYIGDPPAADGRKVMASPKHRRHYAKLGNMALPLGEIFGMVAAGRSDLTK